MSAKSVKASVLKDIIEDVYVSTSFEVAIEIVKEHLEASDIKESECRVILIKATQCAPSRLLRTLMRPFIMGSSSEVGGGSSRENPAGALMPSTATSSSFARSK